MATMVVTGGTGFLGSYLVPRLLAQGNQVWALVRPGSRNLGNLPRHENLHILPLGMDQALDCTGRIGTADAWFHFAWKGVNREELDSPKVQGENVQNSLDCLKAAQLLKCKAFLDAGSRVEYGVTGSVMEEDMECHPINQYGKAKLAFYQQASALSQECGMKYCHMRFFSVYGKGDHPWSIISTLVRELQNGGKVSLSPCLHQWNFLYIKDAVEAVARLYQQMEGWEEGKAMAVNVASADTRVLRSFVEEVRQLAGGRGQLEYGTFVQAKEGALSIRPDIRRLSQLTGGWREAYTFRQGILEMMKKEVERKDEED